MNAKIIKSLKKLEILREIQGKKYSVLALGKGIANIQQYKNVIKNGDDARKNILGIGSGMSQYINLILTNIYPENTGIEEIDNLDKITKKKIKKIYKYIVRYNIDYNLANMFYNSGLSKKEIKEQVLKIEKNENRIPRLLIKDFDKILLNICNNLNIKHKITGSYRRKLPTCGDIDIIIYSKNNENVSLNPVLELLPIVNKLVLGDIKFQGFVYINEDFPNLRIDITIVKNLEELPYSILHTTGNKNLNILMRKNAIKNGWKLNDTKMLDENGDKIIVNNEMEIFELLNMNYLKPRDRNI